MTAISSFMSTLATLASLASLLRISFFRFAIFFLPCVHKIASFADAVNVAAFFPIGVASSIGVGHRGHRGRIFTFDIGVS